jgi:dTDP-4-dehydrorhamnose reductase
LRILLTGRIGQVGWELERALPALGAVIATDRSTVDLADSDAIRRAVREARPQILVNAAAYTAVDRAESEPQLAMAVNGTASGVLAEEARRLGALLVHYSTDYIFDGEKRSPYLETDAPNPINAYGRTKLEGEKRIAASGCRHLLLRTSWVYAPRGRNFFIAIARKAQGGESLKVVADQHGVPTTAEFLASSTVLLLRHGIEGLFNVVPSGSTTWHAFAQAIVKRLGLNNRVDAIATADYPTAARRPQYSVLDITKMTQRLGAPPPWQVLLERCIQAWRRAQ